MALRQREDPSARCISERAHRCSRSAVKRSDDLSGRSSAFLLFLFFSISYYSFPSPSRNVKHYRILRSAAIFLSEKFSRSRARAASRIRRGACKIFDAGFRENVINQLGFYSKFVCVTLQIARLVAFDKVILLLLLCLLIIITMSAISFLFYFLTSIMPFPIFFFSYIFI